MVCLEQGLSLVAFMQDLPDVAALVERAALQLDDAAREWLTAKGYDKLYGARPMGRLIQEKIKQPLAEELLFGKLVHGGEVHISVKEDALAFELTPAPPKLVKRKAAKPEPEAEAPAKAKAKPKPKGKAAKAKSDGDEG